MPDLLISNADGETIAERPLHPNVALTIGRSEGNDLIIPIDSVSRRHVLIFDHGDQWFASDLGSRHGLEDASGSLRFHAFTADKAWVRMGPAYLWVVGVPAPAPSVPPSLIATVSPCAVHLPGDFAQPDSALPPASTTPQPCFLAFSNDGASASRLVDLTLVHRLIIGRDPSCDLVINDADVSHMHAVIYREGRRFFIADAGASKGLRADGSRWLRKRLEPGTLLQFGSVNARVLLPESPVASPTAELVGEEDAFDLGSVFEEPGTWAPTSPKQPRSA